MTNPHILSNQPNAGKGAVDPTAKEIKAKFNPLAMITDFMNVASKIDSAPLVAAYKTAKEGTKSGILGLAVIIGICIMAGDKQ